MNFSEIPASDERERETDRQTDRDRDRERGGWGGGVFPRKREGKGAAGGGVGGYFPEIPASYHRERESR